jgi:putative FmdB family regulatory protein
VSGLVLTPAERAAIIGLGFDLKEAGLPLYEYQCTKCGNRHEKIRKFSDAPLTKCQKCGGKLEQLVSSSAIQFKGSGWYVTDYARKSTPPPTSTASEPSDGGQKKSGESTKTAEPAKAPTAKK